MFEAQEQTNLRLGYRNQGSGCQGGESGERHCEGAQKSLWEGSGNVHIFAVVLVIQGI